MGLLGCQKRVLQAARACDGLKTNAPWVFQEEYLNKLQVSTPKTCSTSGPSWAKRVRRQLESKTTTANGICAKHPDHAASQGGVGCNSVGWILDRC